jgi:hypothetical protein
MSGSVLGTPRALRRLALLSLTLGATGAAVWVAAASANPAVISPTKLYDSSFYGVACASTSQCTGVGEGSEVTFNPTSPGTPTPVSFASISGFGGFDGGVACPTATQCTGAGGTDEVTFNPASPASPSSATLPGGAGAPGTAGIYTHLACPSATQCTAVGGGVLVTFNPEAPGSPTWTVVENPGSLFGIACPSTSQCTAVDEHGGAVTFNPTAPGSPTPTTIDSGATLVGVACASSSLCVAVGNFGALVTFDPTSLGTAKASIIDNKKDLAGVACPSASLCTVVSPVNGGGVMTFNPNAPGNPTPAANIHDDPIDVSCPSLTQCTAVDENGNEVTFDPGAASSGGGSAGHWSAAKCRSTYDTWLKAHKHATAAAKKAETNSLHSNHGCPPSSL